MRVHYCIHCSLPHVQSAPFHTISIIHPATVHTVVLSQTASSSKLCIHTSCHILHNPFTASSMLTLTIFEQSNHEATQHAVFTRCLFLAPTYCQMFHSAPGSVAHSCQQCERVLCPFKTMSKCTYFYTSTLSFSGSRWDMNAL